MMSAGSAAAAVSNLNRTGIQHTPLTQLLQAAATFLQLLGCSIACAFLSCAFLATSAVIDVIWLARM
jgi:hypothetical protein